MRFISILLLLTAFTFGSHAQLIDIGFEVVYEHPDEDITDPGVPGGTINLGGYTTWRLYAYCQNPDDFVTAVVGDEFGPVLIQVEEGGEFYHHPAIASAFGPINDALFGVFTTYEYDSYLTIGYQFSSEFPGESADVNFIQDQSIPWVPQFLEGGDIIIDSFVGGGWFSILGNANGIAGEDNKVLLGQFTANSSITANICVQVFPNGIPPSEDDNYEALTCNHTAIANAGDECMDEDACNYNPQATTDDGSCYYIGNPCDDNDDMTFNDIIVADCQCEGNTAGCTDSVACNYNPFAEFNDGSCAYPEDGCDDENEFTIEDSYQADCTCAGELEGCSDPLALNYDSTSLEPCNGDNSCCVFVPENDEFNNASVLPISEFEQCNYLSGTTLYGSSSAESSLSGIDVWYELTPEFSCFTMTALSEDVSQLNVALYDQNLNLIQQETPSADSESAFQYMVGLEENQTYYIRVAHLSEEATGEFEICVEQMSLYSAAAIGCIVTSCTDPDACNYDPEATEDNGTCFYESDPCFDFDDTTVNDVILPNCNCEGTKQGCTDIQACNFDADAIIDDGTCYFPGDVCNGTVNGLAVIGEYNDQCECEGQEITQILGCLNSFACNYSPNSLIDDGSCAFVGSDCDDENDQTENDVYDDSCNCIGELIPPLEGCMDELACNYNQEAEVDDGSCFFIGDSCDDGDEFTIGEELDENCNCVVIEDPDVGCLDVTACNYSSTAFIDSGLCNYIGDPCNDGDSETVNDVFNDGCNCEGEILTEGCTDSLACNYDAEADIFDDSCVYIGDSCNDGDPDTAFDVYIDDCSCQGEFVELIYGCMESGACNYNPEANIDDGTCVYVGQTCDDNNFATNDETIQEDCTCVGNIEGCTDPAGCNYNPLAVISLACTYPGDSCDDNNFFTIQDEYQPNCTCLGYIGGCTDINACNFDLDAEVDDGTCDYPGDSCNDFNVLTINDAWNDECNCVGQTFGCLDENACNYDPEADIEDNSSCQYFGDTCQNWGSLNDECDCVFSISGYVFIDNNQNGVKDGGEFAITNHELTIQPGGQQVFTNGLGYFSFEGLSPGSYSVTVNYQVSWQLYTTPVSQFIALPPSNNSPEYFGVTNIDLEAPTGTVNVPSEDGMLCGSVKEYKIHYKNTSLYPISGVIEFQFDDLFSYSGSTLAADSVVGNSVYMTYYDLEPYYNWNYDYVNLFTPEVEHIGEYALHNVNLYAWHDGELVLIDSEEEPDQVTCAYDPNDITGFPLGYTDDHLVLADTRMEYVIRFQNTGNAPAQTVLVIDTLDVNLDRNSFEMIEASHDVATSIDENGEIRFLFENINLPDSTANLEESQGSITFKVDFVNDVEVGSEINQTAYIYFDNNDAVVTNTTWHTIHACGGEAEFSASETAVCSGSSIQLNSEYALTEDYSWELNDESLDESSISYTFENPGDYEVTLTAANPLCEETQSQIITVFNLPDAEISENGAVLTANEGTSYQWYVDGNLVPNATAQTYEALEDGSYSVEITNEHGCSSISEAVLIVSIGKLESGIISIYPNPMSKSAIVEFEDAAVRTVRLIDGQGKQIEVWHDVTEQQLTLQRGNLESGKYYLIISEGATQRTLSLVIK